MDCKTLILLFLVFNVANSLTLVSENVVFEKVAEITITLSKWLVAIHIEFDLLTKR